MKRRVRKVVNFFAFNLLFFALYLNFIHKDKPGIEFTPSTTQLNTTSTVKGTVLVENPAQFVQQPAEKTQPSQSSTKTEGQTAAHITIN